MGENSLSAFIAIYMHVHGSRDSKSMHTPTLDSLEAIW